MIHILSISTTDLHARLGSFSLSHGSVTIPNFVPVVDLDHYQITANELATRFRFPLVITSSYLYYKRRQGQDLKPIHEALDYSGPVMTDSGAYQILAYGDVSIGLKEAMDIQNTLLPDIGVILDVPTPPTDDHSTAEKKVFETIARVQEAHSFFEDNGIIWTLPIQGGKYLDLLELYISKVKTLPVFDDYGFFALGSIVPLMNAYEYGILFSMTKLTRRLLPEDRPLHLFGAGHPMMFPFIVALGADTFDSASYALFAEEDRYLTPTGTRHLQDLKELPCNCPVCSNYTAKELQNLPKSTRTKLLEEHNLHVCAAEIRRIRNAIAQGDLWELLRSRAYAHPELFKAFKKAFNDPTYFLSSTPLIKPKGLKLYDHFDLSRPEIVRMRTFLQQSPKFPSSHVRIIIGSNFDVPPLPNFSSVFLHPFLGAIPDELIHVHPNRQSVVAYPCELTSVLHESLLHYLSSVQCSSFSILTLSRDSECSALETRIRELLVSHGFSYLSSPPSQ